MKKFKPTVIVIFLVGLCFRLAMIPTPFIQDERKNVLVARGISFEAENLNLPMESKYVTHPLLNVYVTKIGILLFGESKFGVRILHVLLGSLTMLVVYALVRSIGEDEALLAMFLMAFNQFHIHASIRAENTSLLYLLASLSMLIFWKSMSSGKSRYMLILGPVLGLAYLVKGVNLLLIAAFGLYLIVTPKQHIWFRRKATWISACLFGLTISPWLMWISVYGSSQLIFDKKMYTISSLIPNRTALNLYLIEPIAWIRGINYRMQISWEYGIMDGITGVVLFGVVIWSMRMLKGDIYKYFHIIFLVFMVVLSFFTLPNSKWGEFWWASVSLVPVICLVAVVFKNALIRRGWPRFFVMAFLVYSFLNAGRFVAMAYEEFKYPPHRLATFVDDDYISAKIYDDQQMPAEAIKELQKLLDIAPNNVENLNYLGWLNWETGKFNKAVILWMKSLELEPDYQSVLNKLYIFSHERIFDLQDELEVKPDDEQLRFILAKLYYHADDFVNAERELLKVLELDPFLTDAHYYLGLLRMKQLRFPHATRVFEKVLDLDSFHYRTYYQMGMVYLKLKKVLKAEGYFQKALKYNPDDAKSYFELSKIYDQQKKEWMARRMIRQANQIYHNDIKTKTYGNMLGRYKILFKPE